MATQMQLRGGTTAETLLFTGAQREVTVDTDKNTVVVHDGITPGGYPVATEEQVSDGTFYYNDDVPGGSVANAYILVPKSNTNTPNSYMDGIQLGFVTANANTGPAAANFQGLGVKNIKYPGGVDPAPGDVSGRVTLIYDAGNGWLELQRKPAGNPPQLRTVGGSVSGNALTLTLDPCNIDFRSPTIGSGTVLTRVVTSTISLVVPAGATLGTTSGVQSRIVVVAIDNAGVVELAAINLAGGFNLDETTLINTTAISGAASSASTFYSASARSGVAFRVMGYVQSTQAAAGTWSTTPSQVQGQGGQNIIMPPQILSGTVQNTTSGTAIDFTGLPPGINRLTLMFNGVSLSGTAQFLLQIGTSSGVETSGYTSYGVRAAGAAVAGSASSAGIYMPITNAADAHSGTVVFNRISGNIWAAQGAIASANYLVSCAGGKSLAGVLDRIRLTSTGADTFDAGSINIQYEV